MVVDAAGDVFISGWTRGGLDGPNAGGADAFLAKYDNSGNIVWTHQFGTPGEDFGLGESVDALGNIYISGFTDASLGGTSAGEWDAFVAKFVIPEPATLGLMVIGGLALLRRGR